MSYTPKPTDGSPWVVPPSEARGYYLTTNCGPIHISEFVPRSKLRPDQLRHKPKFNPGHHAG